MGSPFQQRRATHSGYPIMLWYHLDVRAQGTGQRMLNRGIAKSPVVIKGVGDWQHRAVRRSDALWPSLLHVLCRMHKDPPRDLLSEYKASEGVKGNRWIHAWERREQLVKLRHTPCDGIKERMIDETPVWVRIGSGGHDSHRPRERSDIRDAGCPLRTREPLFELLVPRLNCNTFIRERLLCRISLGAASQG